MEASVRQQLIEMSADFYRSHADSFSETRQNAWDSWQKILTRVLELGQPTDILDLGCGNGRFASFLEDAGLTNFSYTGIDAEEQLILKAQARHPDKRFHVSDLDRALETTSDAVDLIVCFGVFHHLPGKQYRFDVLRKFVSLLRPGGVAAISLWQPKLLSNFKGKAYHDHDVSGLENNDVLLGWRGDFSHLRYCHHFDDIEIDELIAASQLALVTQFQGTGNDRTNRYLIFKSQDKAS